MIRVKQRVGLYSGCGTLSAGSHPEVAQCRLEAIRKWRSVGWKPSGSGAVSAGSHPEVAQCRLKVIRMWRIVAWKPSGSGAVSAESHPMWRSVGWKPFADVLQGSVARSVFITTHCLFTEKGLPVFFFLM
jgi:hypothetical protein